jgi:tRNA G10  N-methylase Trm11
MGSTSTAIRQPPTFLQLMRPKQYLVRFIQQHPTFRRSELESCAVISDSGVGRPLSFVEYDDSSPFAVLELENENVAAAIVERSILTQ